ncbi:WD repeat-containing protein 75 [Purpureocillium lavendulum]|uniref:WD repeat-containing protein 75 n=1 Tax=Purpureocillium lavendulum TaxID=1247861 RepID=A0AB34FX53_9HYPO|nr:WD repeat-containing protein 75 [Purpureocillium lavendulum]
MAGLKSPRVKDDKTKKRKREANDADTKAKRHRQQARQGKPNGLDGDSEADKLIEADSLLEVAADSHNEVVGRRENGEAGWRISKPMGGRMLDIDPILTADDRYLILTYNTSIQVYTANDSLLVRRIPITSLDSSAPQGSTPATIISTRLSVRDPNFAWVACSDGRVYHVDWTQSTEAPTSFQTASGTAKAMAVVPTQRQGKGEDIVLVVESDKEYRMEVVAYQGKVESSVPSKSLLVLKKHGAGLQLLEASADGQVLVGAFHDRLFVGVASQSGAAKVEELQYEFYSFDTPDLITSLSMRVHKKSGSRKGQTGFDKPVDVTAGGARGAIFVYNDVLARLQAAGKSQAEKDGVQVQRLHWHRRAVHSVKWSRDGNYILSGGSENTLVLWQVDTGKKDFLPHLSGSVENIVVSSAGSSYVVHLDDNSCMILSTAEMKPTAYVSGIQSAAIDVATPKDLLVKRTWSTADQVRRPIPAAIKPSDPSKLHVCVGNGRQASMAGDFSAPLLQTFDLESFTSVTKQALARTQTTANNMTSKGHTIDEPLVSHIAFSGDGKWLASVDEWKPSSRDVENVSSDLRDQFIRERREIYLKFWEVHDSDESVALVSRINTPHATNHPESVLDLASDPTSTSFATIGADGIVRVWRPKARQQNGLAVKGSEGRDTVTWGCSQIVAVGDYVGREAGAEVSAATTPAKAQGSITFSEDGSTLFAAFGATDVGVVYVIDAASGRIVKTLEGMWSGQLQSIRALSSFVLVLSKDLRVYDVVGDELQYGIVIPEIPGVNELLQIAVDYTSGHFAVTLPIGGISSVGIFDPEDPEPLLVRSTPHRIVSLVSAPTTSGFIALDDAAQVWVIAEGSDPSALTTVQPLQDLQLDGPAAEEDSKDMILDMEDAGMASDEEMDDQEPAEEEDVDMDDDDFHPSIIPQQYLADIFDAAPAFAAPSVEDMFYKVTGLLATKPLSSGSA